MTLIPYLTVKARPGIFWAMMTWCMFMVKFTSMRMFAGLSPGHKAGCQIMMTTTGRAIARCKSCLLL